MIRLGPLDLVKRIGRGGMAEVWKARHRRARQDLAIKIVTARQATQAMFQQALRHEVRAMARLSHPSIVQVLDQGVVDRANAEASRGGLVEGSPWFAMEMVEGRNLQQRAQELDWPQLRGWLLQVLGGLAHAHARGVLHRDLKPANVLIEEATGRAVLTDFGIARIGGGPTGAESDGLTVGTPAFMSPEQVYGELRRQGPWTDVFGLGCLAWRLLTGGSAYGASPEEVERRLLEAGRPHPFEPRIEVPSYVEPWLLRCLAPSPGRRFPTAAAAAAALEAGAAEVRVAVPATWRSLPPTRPRRLLPGLGGGLIGFHPAHTVGRDAERDALWNHLRAVLERRRARVVRLAGPRGAGRSHLARWLARGAAELGLALAFHGRLDEEGPAALLARAWQVEGIGPPLLEDLVGWWMDTFAPGAQLPSAEVVAQAILGMDLQGSPLPRDRVESVVAAVLQGLARVRPVVVVLDAADADPRGMDFARSLVAGAPDAPLLVVASTGPEVAAGGAEPVVEVGPLPDADLLLLLHQGLGVSPALAERLVHDLGGSPALALRVVERWAAEGLLQPGAQGLDIQGDALPHLPEDLVESWLPAVDAVLDRLPGRQRRVLQVAALLGRRVPLATWQPACSRLGLRVDVRLPVVLERHGLAFPLRDGGIRFAEAEVPAAILARLEEGVAEAHAACADALSDDPERRAHHLVECGRLEEAIDPLAEAALRRVRSNEPVLAEGLIDRRRELLERLKVPYDDPRWAEDRLIRSHVAGAMGRTEDAEKWANRALEAARASGDPVVLARCLRQAGRLARMRGDRGEAWKLLEEARTRASEVGDRRTLADCLRDMGDVLSDVGRLRDSALCYGRAARIYRALDDLDGLARCLTGRSLVERKGGHLEEALRIQREAEAIYRRTGNRWGLASSANDVADLLRVQGRLEEAEAGFREARRRYLELGLRPTIPDINLGLVLAARGRHREARALLARIRVELAARRRWDNVSYVDVAMLVSDAALGDWEAFDDHLRDALEILGRHPHFDADVAQMAADAARRAAEAGQAARAARARELARAQYLGLGRLREAETLEG